MTIDQLKKLAIQARKNKAPEASILTLIIGEHDTASKRGDTVEVNAVIKKLIKSAGDVLKHAPGDEKATFEVNYLSGLLPKDRIFTEDEVRTIIARESATNVGQVMKALATESNGEPFDKRSASAIAQKVLAE
jgi:hypothetical protein